MRFLFIFAFLVGCATAPVVCPICPPEDVIISTEAGPIFIEKGLIVPNNYYTQEEWDQLVKEYYDSLLIPKQNL